MTTPPTPLPDLSPDELRRYARHLVLPEVGLDGQRRLKAARVLLVGAGGLGSPAALYLAAAGVGTLGLVDFDRVDESNLQRQVLFGQADVGRPKVEAAAERLSGINPHVALELHAERLGADNVAARVEAYDLVVDGSDNFPTRYLVNDACVAAGKADVWGAVFRFEGQVAVFWAERGPCYRCLFPEPPPPGLVPSCAEGGVLGVLPGVIGALQAAEAIKLILGAGDPAIGRLVLYDALKLEFRSLKLAKDPDCPVCARPGTRPERVEVGAVCAPAAEEPWDVAPGELAEWLAAGRGPVLLDVRHPYEAEICHLPGSHLVSLHELPERWGELDPQALTVVYCHLGGRSAEAVAYLRARGFARAVNLAGGIEGWSREVDPTVPRY